MHQKQTYPRFALWWWGVLQLLHHTFHKACQAINTKNPVCTACIYQPCVIITWEVWLNHVFKKRLTISEIVEDFRDDLCIIIIFVTF